MKKQAIIAVSFILICVFIMTGCDPIYPPGNLKVEKIAPIAAGESVDIRIIYPNIGGSIVTGWKDERIEIISGDDILSVSGLTVTGLKSGTAVIRVSATTVLTDGAYEAGDEEQTYSAEVEIKVK